jgi:hypothetical protein
MNELSGAGFSVSVLTWYSMMASLRSSARLDTAIVSPSSSLCPVVLRRSDMRCSLSLIPSRALMSGQRGQSLAADGGYTLK